jgi:hypothetical protein
MGRSTGKSFGTLAKALVCALEVMMLGREGDRG